MVKLLLNRSMVIFFLIIIFGLKTLAQLPEGISLSPLNSDGFTSITLTFDPALACDNGTKTLVGETKIQMHSSAHTTNKPMSGWGNYGIDYNAVPLDGTHTTTDLTDNLDGTFSITMVPADFYGIPGDSGIIGLSIVFNNGSWDKEGKDKDGSNCVDFKVLLNNAPSAGKSLVPLNRFSFSPNPVKEIIRISSSEKIYAVFVSDILGKQVLKVPGNENINQVVNTQNLVKGIYIISVYDARGFAGRSKLVKE